MTWTAVAAADSDHRIIVTHFWDMALICLNGRWDPLLEMTVNAIFHAIYACGLAFSLWHFDGRKNAWLVCGLLLPFFALPFAGENAIWGLNSLWYLINIFGLVAIVGMGFSRMWSWPWWTGLGAVLLGLFTMALGPIVPVAIGGLGILRAIKYRRLAKEDLIPLGMCLPLAVIGVAMGVHKNYNPLEAHSFADFVGALVRHLDWPFYKLPFMAGVILLPPVLLLICYLRPDFKPVRQAEFLLTLALWSVLQSIVLAFGRANYGDIIPASRYTEVFSLLLIASVFSSVVLVEQWLAVHFPKWNTLLLPLVFAGVIFWGLYQMSEIVVDNLLVQTRVMNLIASERITTYLASGNENDLLERPTIRPDPKTALAVLSDPTLQPILPAACVSPASAGRAGWLTVASREVLEHSETITIAGLILFTGLCGVGLARGSMGLTIRKPEGIFMLMAGVAALVFVLSERSLQRGSVERGLEQQLAEYYKSSGSLTRAAFHAQKADELGGSAISKLPF